MSYKRTIYSIIVIIITIFSVSIILDSRVNTSEITVSYYTEDKLKDGIESYAKVLPKEVEPKVEVKEEPKEPKEPEEPNEVIVEEEKPVNDNSMKTFSQSLMNKRDEMFSKFEYYTEYDKETQDFFMTQLEEGIRRAKLNQFEGRLSQNETIEDINVSKIENKLSTEDKNELQRIIDELGPVNSLKLMKILNNGINPEEQQDMQDLLKDKLNEEDIILLNDILGRYMDK